jgi:hypothetical protein
MVTPSRPPANLVLGMDFLFVCPLRQETSSSADFEIIDNRGVAVDADGTRYLSLNQRAEKSSR